MFELVEKTKGLIVKLNEIQPAVSVAGLIDETEVIKNMKIDLVLMMSKMTPDHPCMQRVLDALREDVVSSGTALYDYMGRVCDCQEELTDRYLQLAILAAEAFVIRGRDYLGSKRKHFELTGGKHGRA